VSCGVQGGGEIDHEGSRKGEVKMGPRFACPSVARFSQGINYWGSPLEEEKKRALLFKEGGGGGHDSRVWVIHTWPIDQ